MSMFSVWRLCCSVALTRIQWCQLSQTFFKDHRNLKFDAKPRKHLQPTVMRLALPFLFSSPDVAILTPKFAAKRPMPLYKLLQNHCSTDTLNSVHDYFGLNVMSLHGIISPLALAN